MYQPGADKGREGQINLAIFMAAALHGMLILGITFSADSAPQYSPQIEVTLAQRHEATAPDDARHFAQSNQTGSGDQSERNEMSSEASASMVSPALMQQLLQEYPGAFSRQRADPTVTTTSEAARQIAKELEAQEQAEPALPGISPEVNQLSDELANLEAALDEQTRAYSSMPRVRRLTSVSTRRAVDAAYLHDWRQRVEAVGNQYYPEASVRYGIYGSLRLLVVIQRDGSLEDIKVLSSSGYALLDEAAIKIVRMAAPYSPFPEELRATTDKLEIIRTWQFEENRLSSG